MDGSTGRKFGEAVGVIHTSRQTASILLGVGYGPKGCVSQNINKKMVIIISSASHCIAISSRSNPAQIPHAVLLNAKMCRLLQCEPVWPSGIKALGW